MRNAPNYTLSPKASHTFVRSPFAADEGLLMRRGPRHNAVVYTREFEQAVRCCEQHEKGLDIFQCAVGKQLGQIGYFADWGDDVYYHFLLTVALPHVPSNQAIWQLAHLRQVMGYTPNLIVRVPKISDLLRSYALWQHALSQFDGVVSWKLQFECSLEEQETECFEALLYLLDEKAFSLTGTLDLCSYPDMTKQQATLENIEKMADFGHALPITVVLPDLLALLDFQKSEVLELVADLVRLRPTSTLDVQVDNREPSNRSRLRDWYEMECEAYLSWMLKDNFDMSRIHRISSVLNGVLRQPYSVQSLEVDLSNKGKEVLMRASHERNGTHLQIDHLNIHEILVDLDRDLENTDPTFNAVHPCGRFLPRLYPAAWLMSGGRDSGDELLAIWLKGLSKISRLCILQLLHECHAHSDATRALKWNMSNSHEVYYTQLDKELSHEAQITA